MAEVELRLISVGEFDETFCDNSITTSKYTIWNFLPVAIGEQFRKVGNIYFLTISVFMAVGYYGDYFDSAVNPSSTVLPLMLVVAFSICQEGISDVSRHRSDQRTNQYPCSVLRRVDNMEENPHDSSTSIMEGKRVRVALEMMEDIERNGPGSGEMERLTTSAQNQSASGEAVVSIQNVERSKIFPGDIVLIKNREMVPSDVVLIASSGEKGSAYIETSSIDGETNLKLRLSPNLNVIPSSYQPPTIESAGEDDEALRKSHQPPTMETLEQAIKRCVKFSKLGYPNGFSALENPSNTADFSRDEYILQKRQSNTILKSLSQMLNITSSDKVEDPSNSEDQPYTSVILSEQPNSSVNTFTGQLVLPPLYEGQSSIKVALGPDNILLRGSMLRNTEWALGITVFTGADSKLVQNSVDTPLKLSLLDSLVNKAIIMVIIVNILTVLVIGGVALGANSNSFSELWYVGYEDDNKEKWPYLPHLEAPDWEESTLNYLQFAFLYLTLFSNFVPVSLYITMDLIKFCFIKLINDDLEMYHEETDTPAAARSTNATDLGSISYVFSDKTGTLTDNVMRFKRCSVDGFVFGAPVMGMKENTSPFHPLRQLLISGFNFDQLNLEQKEFLEAGNEPHQSSFPFKYKLSFNGEMFLRVMSICHTVVVEKNYDNVNSVPPAKQSAGTSEKENISSHNDEDQFSKGEDGAPLNFTYQAESPDEGALVSAASLIYGYQLVSRDSSGIRLNRYVPSLLQESSVVDGLKSQELTPKLMAASGNDSSSNKEEASLNEIASSYPEEEVWEILAVNKFDSDRKRMSILVRSPKEMGSIPILFCKGADSSMLDKNVCEEGDVTSKEILNDSLISKESSKAEQWGLASSLGLQTHLGEFASDGLRTLVLGIRILSEEECSTWLATYETASTSVSNRKQLLRDAAKEIETKLHIVGATAIEDKLQDGVPEAIANLGKAGIKLWVLTGDKRETAIEIGYSTNVLNPEMQLIEIVHGSDIEVRKALATAFLRLVKNGELKQYQYLSIAQEEERNKTTYFKALTFMNETRITLVNTLSMLGQKLCCREASNINEKNVAPSRAERLRAVREKAQSLYAAAYENLGNNPDQPKIFSRANSARDMLEKHRLSGNLSEHEQQDLSIAKMTAMGFPHTRTDSKVEDSLSMESFSLSVKSLSERKDCGLNTGNQTLFERLFAVDRGVRLGQLAKHTEIGTSSTQSESKSYSKALVIEGSALSHLLGDKILEEMVFAVGSCCDAVIACRSSPQQKALLVRMVRTYVTPETATLAIGDGANDVGMIQEAHVGVGISGKEGQQAVNSSDFAIAQFRFLESLLLVHGRWNFIRMSKAVLFSFYKNAVLVGLLVSFQSKTLCSGTPFFNEYVQTMFNFVVGAPICIVGFFDRDLEKDYVKKNAGLYSSGRENEHLSTRMMLRWFCLTILHTVCVFFLTVPIFSGGGTITSAFDGLMNNKHSDIPGDAEVDLITIGTSVYVVLIILLNYKVLYESRSLIYGNFPYIRCKNTDKETWLDRLAWTWFGIIILSFGFWMGFIYFYSVLARDYFEEDNFNDIAFHVYNRSTVIWLAFLLVPIAGIICDVAAKLFASLYFPTQTQIHAEIEVKG